MRWWPFIHTAGKAKKKPLLLMIRRLSMPLSILQVTNMLDNGKEADELYHPHVLGDYSGSPYTRC